MPETKSTTFEINQEQTQILLTTFANMILLIITQTGKIGSLTLVEKPQLSTIVNTEILLGDRNDLLLSVYGSQVMKILNTDKQIMMGLSLVKMDESGQREALKAIKEELLKIIE